MRKRRVGTDVETQAQKQRERGSVEFTWCATIKDGEYGGRYADFGRRGIVVDWRKTIWTADNLKPLPVPTPLDEQSIQAALILGRIIEHSTTKIRRGTSDSVAAIHISNVNVRGVLDANGFHGRISHIVRGYRFPLNFRSIAVH